MNTVKVTLNIQVKASVNLRYLLQELKIGPEEILELSDETMRKITNSGLFRLRSVNFSNSAVHAGECEVDKTNLKIE